MMNMAMKPTAKCSAVVPRIVPPHSVAIQLKIFTPVGTAISIVVAEKTESAIGPSPTENRSEEHTSELQSQSNLVCRLLLEKKKKTHRIYSAGSARERCG